MTAGELARYFRVTIRSAYGWAALYQAGGGPVEAYKAEGSWYFGVASVRRFVEGQIR